ncbi:MAG: hypothetical protein PHU77_13555, partial [Simplicispira sp.]|nr:hypothetical protein [Simplicispira sp.]
LAWRSERGTSAAPAASAPVESTAAASSTAPAGHSATTSSVPSASVRQRRSSCTTASTAPTAPMPVDAVQQFVHRQSAAALAERLWAWAGHDADLMAELKAWAAGQQAADNPLALRRAMTELLASAHPYLDFHQALVYARRAAGVLPWLSPWLARDPAVLRSLCVHALHGIYPVAARADDADGALAGVVDGLMALLIEALRAAPPPAEWVDEWWALTEADPWEHGDEPAVLAAAGPAVQVRHAERARAAWDDWLRRHPPARQPALARRPAVADEHERGALRRRYLNSLRAQNDPQGLLAAMAESAQQPGEFDELVRWCEAQGLHAQALHWAQVAAQQHPGDRVCQGNLLGCHEHYGHAAEALPLWRQRLQAQPSASNYLAVLSAAERAGHDRAAYRAELFAWLQEREQAEMERQRKSPFRQSDSAIGPRVGVQIQWHLAEGDLPPALALALQPGNLCDMQTLQALALQLPPEHNATAVELLLRVFEPLMAMSASPYTEALALVHDVLARITGAEKLAWLTTLRAQYKDKHNFLAGLP